MTIEPDFLDDLDRFDTAVDRKTTELARGEQRSSELGEGLTFSDYRRYVPGDDTRLIDWNVYSRTGEFYIKQFESERNLTVHVLLDGTASMGFQEAAKFEFAATIGLGFCSLFVEENNDFRVSLFRDVPERLDSGAATHGEILGLIDRLNDTVPAGKGSVRDALADYAATISSRSLVVVGSDFLFDPDDLAAGLEPLAEQDVVLVHTVAPEEVSPPVDGETIFEGLELPRRLRTYFSPRAKERYRDRLEAHWQDLESVARTQGARYVRLRTDEAFFDAFGRAWIG